MKSFNRLLKNAWPGAGLLMTALALASSLPLSAGQLAADAPAVKVPARKDTQDAGTSPAPVRKDPAVERSRSEENQTPEPPAPNATGTPPQPAQEAVSDPTIPGPELRNLLRPAGTSAAAPPPPPLLPVISLKGRVINSLDEGIILLSVGDQLFRLRAGNEIRVLAGTTLTTIHIDEITEESVEVRITPQNENLSLR